MGVRISSRPVVGAIAQWNAGERSPWWANGSPTANGYIQAGPYGHVGIVKQVNADGSALVEQYNMSGSRSYSITRVKAPRYLYDGVAGYPAARWASGGLWSTVEDLGRRHAGQGRHGRPGGEGFERHHRRGRRVLPAGQAPADPRR